MCDLTEASHGENTEDISTITSATDQRSVAQVRFKYNEKWEITKGRVTATVTVAELPHVLQLL